MFNRLILLIEQRGFQYDGTGVILSYDGQTYNIAFWDANKYGPLPTSAEVQAVDNVQADNAANTRNRNMELNIHMMRALARGIHVRLARPDWNTMNAQTWRNILEAAWDAEK